MNEQPTYDDLYEALSSVTKRAIIQALEEYDSDYPNNDYENWLENTNYKYAVNYKGRIYPPKYIMGKATNIWWRCFSGGWGPYGVNGPFEREGFTITDKT